MPTNPSDANSGMTAAPGMELQSTLAFGFPSITFADMSTTEVTAAEAAFSAVFTATTELVPESVTAQASTGRRRDTGDLEMVVLLKAGADGETAKIKFAKAVAAGTAKVLLSVGGNESEVQVATPQVSNKEVPASGKKNGSAATTAAAASVAAAAVVAAAL